MQDAKMHVDIICLHVNMIYFACRGSFTRNIQVLAVSGWIKQRISLGIQFRMTPIKICRKYWLEKKSSTKGNRTISRYRYRYCYRYHLQHKAFFCYSFGYECSAYRCKHCRESIYRYIYIICVSIFSCNDRFLLLNSN